MGLFFFFWCWDSSDAAVEMVLGDFFNEHGAEI